jgi:glycerophosphoryl diester phosphodiesterase
MTPPPRISWHRGGAELAPYATLAAFSSAAAHGAELIEVDVRRSADGVMVCAHDPVVRGLGRLDRLSWDELSKQRPGLGRVASFTELLDALDAADPARRSDVHLDLKEAGFEAEAVAAVLERGRHLVVTSSDTAVVATTRRAHPRVPALLTLGHDGSGLRPGELARVRAHELVPFSDLEECGATGAAAHFLLATPLLRRWCTRRGMQLLVWTVDGDAALARWLARADVDVVTTNRPLAASSIRDRLARREP